MKRQANSIPSSLSNCVDICSTDSDCVATTYDSTNNVCTYYSAITGTFVAQGLDSAIRVASNDADTTQTVTVVSTLTQTNTVVIGGQSTVQIATVTQTAVQTVCPVCAITSVPSGAIQAGGSLSTATLYSTTVVTISSCAPTVTNCPLRNGQNSAVMTTVVPVALTTYICPVPSQNANVVTALQGAVTVQNVVTSTVYSCPAGQSVVISGTAVVPTAATTVTQYYTTQVTNGASSAAPPTMTGSNASKSVVYVQQVVSAGPSATNTLYVVVSTASPAPVTTAVTTVQVVPCNGAACPTAGAATYKININTDLSAANGTAATASGMSTASVATATVSKPAMYTGAASVVSVQGAFVAVAAAFLSALLF
jgi:hypothetical protein